MIAEEPFPPINRLFHTRPGKTDLPLPSDLPLRIRDLLILHILHGDESFFGADQIRCDIFLETARHKGAGGIMSCEEIVASAASVDGRVGGDVEDGAVHGEIDWEGGIGAIVESELGGGKIDGAGLEREVQDG